MDPNHRDTRAVHGTAVGARHPHFGWRSGLRRQAGNLLGSLAHSVLAVGGPSCGFDLDPAATERVARVPENEGRGQRIQAPLTEAFGNWANLKIAILALFGATAGEAVSGTAGNSTRCSSSPRR